MQVFHELEVHQIELEMQNAELHRARNALESALESYTDLYDFAPVGYFSIDASGLIMKANLTGASLLRVERSRLINRRLPMFVSPATRPGFLAFLERVFAGSEDRSCEAELLRDGGESFWASFRAAPAVAPDGAPAWCRLAFGDITARKQAEEDRRRLDALTRTNRELNREIARRRAAQEALRESERHQRRLVEQSHRMQGRLRHMAHRILHAQEEERKRISRELHDEIAQTLVGINEQLAGLTRGTARDAKIFERRIVRTKRLVEAAVELVHRFARELRPTTLDVLGLLPALRTLFKEFTERTGVRVQVTASRAVEELSLTKRTVLYRVAQEALTNVARHAKASRVDVTIRKLPHDVCMTIADDGRSFQVERVMQRRGTKHLGLLGMQERLEMVGGRLEVTSEPGKGTTITAHVKTGKTASR